MIERIAVFGIIQCLVGVAMISLAVVAWRNREHPVGIPLAVFAIGTAGWAFSNGLRPFAMTPAMIEILGLIEHPFSGVTALGWLYVAVTYTDTERLTGRWVVALLTSVVIVDTLLVVTNPLHQSYAGPESRVASNGSYIFQTGPLYAYHVVYAFGFGFLGWGLFGRAYLKSQGMYRKQVLVILGSATVAIISIAVEVATRPIQGLSLGILGLAVAAGGFFWSIFVADFLNTVPVARETLVESMDDAVIGLDTTNHVIAMNPAARELFDLTETAVGQPVTDVLDSYPTFAGWFESDNITDSELTVQIDGQTKHYAVTVSTVASETRLSDTEIELGRAVRIRDISDRVARQRQLETQTEQLAGQKDRLRRQNERLDRFGTAVSQDLRESLDVAQSRLENARSSEEIEQINAVREAHSRIQHIIDDMLTIASVDTTIDSKEPVDLTSLLKEAWDEERTANESSTLKLPDKATIVSNPTIARKIFENLFWNATAENKVVTVETVRDSGSLVGIDIIANGEKQEDSKAETDISLSIIEGLVDVHGWSIEQTGEDQLHFEIRNVEFT